MAIEIERSFNPMSLAFVEGLYADYVKDPPRFRSSGVSTSSRLARTMIFCARLGSVRAFSPRRSSTRRR